MVNKKLLLITGLAVILRLVAITRVPLSLNWDETTFAYNAYSLLHTGKDEYGKVLPLEFESIGDYKAPMFIYLLVPTIKILGLNELAVRIIPAILGGLIVIALFSISWSLLKNKNIALLAGLFLAISPWHLQFTRAGADVAESSFFLIFGLALFFRKKLNLAAISLTATFYCYYGERFFTPVILLALLWYGWKTLLGERIKTIRAIAVGGILFLPIVVPLLSQGHQNKIVITTLFGYRPSDEQTAKESKEDGNEIVYLLFHNRVGLYANMIASRYANHFSPKFLFANGPDDNRQRIEGMGMMYWSDLVWILVGLWWFASRFKRDRNVWFLLLWLALAPLPAAITRDAVHARRAFNMVYPLIIISAAGFWCVWNDIKSRKWLMLLGPWMLWSVGFYFLSYYVLTPLVTFRGSAGWQYGYKQLVQFVAPLKNNYDKIVVDTSYQGPYAYFLFYEKYSPRDYQPQAKLVKTDPNGLGEGPGYDKYEFRSVFWPQDRGKHRTLFAGPPEKIPLKDIDPKQAKLLDTIYFPDHTPAFYVVEVY